MSFDDLTPMKKGARLASPIPCRVGMQARGDAPARMRITLHADAMKVFGTAKSFRLALGKAEDRHLLKITPDSSGLWQPSKLPGRSQVYQYFMLPPNDRFPNVRVESDEVKFETEAKTRSLLITLPAWAWDEKRKREVEQTARPLAVKKAA